MPPEASGRRPSLVRRLRGTGAFEAVFASGRRFDGRYLQLVAAPAVRPVGRVGYVIGRKAMPRAVDRNRLRRRLREIVRAARPALDAYDVILRVRSAVSAVDVDAAALEGARLVASVTASSGAAA